jgi:hypothetical protein
VTGPEVLARLCAISPKTRVIVITAREDLAARACNSHRASHLFMKPFDDEKFIAAVRDALSKPEITICRNETRFKIRYLKPHPDGNAITTLQQTGVQFCDKSPNEISETPWHVQRKMQGAWESCYAGTFCGCCAVVATAALGALETIRLAGKKVSPNLLKPPAFHPRRGT